MEKTNKILKVPTEEILRNNMRKEAALLVEKVNLLPPAKFDVLKQLATQLLNEHNISEDYQNFAIVLLGNESWRKTVKATPMHRRLLLLPQCLRKKDQCRGVFDELGLNCAGCKACPIDDILLEAENQGYANLVAEGTTIAIGLVEEGSIDAVIGVSCMPVLQRSFEPVSNAAVPVIGIPLLFDGCENTKADVNWILEEIKTFESDTNYEPISVSQLKNRIQDYFTENRIKKYFAEKDETERIALEFILAGGQRMRPLLTALSFAAYANNNNDELLFPLALIIECFHKASLIHDDIQDNSDHRYNTSSIHKKYGVPLAINAGDFLIGRGYELLADLPVDAKIISQSLKAISQSHVKLTHGQGNDILFNSGNLSLNLDKVLQVFSNKTGEAIKVALVLGAIAGGANENDLATLQQFADYFGIAYQIRDDLNEFKEQNTNEKTADFPFLLALINTIYSEQKEDIPENILTETSTFRKIIETEKLEVKAHEYLSEYTQKCYMELDKLENAKLRLSLYRVLGKIFKPINSDE